MKIFKALQVQWDSFQDAASKFLASMLGGDGKYGPSNIFGQFITVLNGAVQNVMLYIEDAFTEQNIHTATRKKSIYSLARLSGYNPSLGKAAKASAKLIYNSKSGINQQAVVVPNRTQIISSQNGLIYNIILPQDSCVFDIGTNTSIKHVSIVEGKFESRSFTSTGGEMYSYNILFNGDVDIDFFTVLVNGEEWERVDGFYDMLPDSKQYFIQTGMDRGIDIIFGNGQYGKILQDGDVVNIEFLSHNGELGNIRPDENNSFIFNTSLTNISGEDISGDECFRIELEDRNGIYNGMYSEDVEHVRKMIGYNSRSLVLADEKNYKLFIDRFSFVGYNKCWSERGSLVINASVIKNYKQLYNEPSGYFNCKESDFYLSNEQKESISNAIIDSKQQIAGTVLNFVDPIIKKYAMFIYVKPKDGIIYYKDNIEKQIKDIIGEKFSYLTDNFIPKSEIIQEIKNNIPQLDSVDIYIISEDNEIARSERKYIEKKLTYDPSKMTYKLEEIIHVIPINTDPHIGFDDHGNIYLDNDLYFPILMGGWSYKVNNSEVITEPIQIIFQS